MIIFPLECANLDSWHVVFCLDESEKSWNCSSNWNTRYNTYLGRLDPCHSCFYMLKLQLSNHGGTKFNFFSSQDWFFLWADMLHRSTLSRYILKVIRHAVINDHGRLLEMLQNNSEPSSICNFQGWLESSPSKWTLTWAGLNFSFLPLPLLLYNSEPEMDTAPHEFLCKLLSWTGALFINSAWEDES